MKMLIKESLEEKSIYNFRNSFNRRKSSETLFLHFIEKFIKLIEILRIFLNNYLSLRILNTGKQRKPKVFDQSLKKFVNKSKTVFFRKEKQIERRNRK